MSRPTRPGGAWARRLALLLCALPPAAVVALRRTFDVDLPWHLATGRLALALRSTLPVDPFSFGVGAHAAWPYKDLVADVLLWAGFSRLGYVWLALLKGAAVLGIAAALWLAPPRPRRALLPWLLGLSAYLLAIQYRVAERPLLASLAAYPLLLALCERARRLLGRPAVRPRLALAALGPPVLLLWAWAQLHREAMVGIVTFFGLPPILLLGRLLRGTNLRPLCRPATGRAAAYALAAALSAAALVLLNPSGAAFYQTTLSLSRSAVLQDLLLEWKALPPGEMLRLFPGAVLLCAAGLGAMLLRLGVALRRSARSPVDLWHLGLYALLLGRVGGSIRWLPSLVGVSGVALTLCLGEIVAQLRRAGARARAGRPPRGLAPLFVTAAAAALVLTSTYAVGVGPLPDHYPYGALAFARERGLRERVANAFGFGGAVILAGSPAFRVLIDGRTDMIYEPGFVLRCARAQREAAAFAAMRAEDGADWALAVNRPGQETHLFLAEDPAWALVYLDEAAAVYVRADAYPQLLPLRLRHLRPGALLGSLLEALRTAAGDPAQLQEIEAEVRRLLAASPQGVRALSLAALLAHHLGRPQERDLLIERLLEAHPDHPGAREVLRRVGRSEP